MTDNQTELLARVAFLALLCGLVPFFLLVLQLVFRITWEIAEIASGLLLRSASSRHSSLWFWVGFADSTRNPFDWAHGELESGPIGLSASGIISLKRPRSSMSSSGSLWRGGIQVSHHLAAVSYILLLR
jgi:hypothetical protein